MIRTVTLQATISSERELRIEVPDDVPLGNADIVVVIASSDPSFPAGGTAEELLHSPLFGLWESREDITDPYEFARSLRTRAEQRYRG